MTNQATLPLILAAASWFCATPLSAQSIRPEPVPVSGSCVSSLANETFRRETCELNTEDGSIPAGMRLAIEHVSATCTTAPPGVFTLALITKTTPNDRGRIMQIPLSVLSSMGVQVRLAGAQMVRSYAGAGTTVQLLLSTWQSAYAGPTSCDVTFSGILYPAAS